MRRFARDISSVSTIALCTIAATTELALAGAPIPGPAAGVGLPILALVGGAIWLIARIRSRGGSD